MAAISNGVRRAAFGAVEERQEAEFWINVGFQQGDTFVSLPVGIPIDQIKRLNIPKTEGPFRDLQATRNALLDKVLEKGRRELEPGESVKLKLEVELRRVNQTKDVPTETLVIPEL